MFALNDINLLSQIVSQNENGTVGGTLIDMGCHPKFGIYIYYIINKVSPVFA